MQTDAQVAVLGRAYDRRAEGREFRALMLRTVLPLLIQSLFMQSLTFVAIIGVAGIAGSLRSDFLPAHLGRAALLLVGNVSFVLALRYLPLTEANVIGFASPLIITALSYPVLGQRVSARRWAS